MPSTPAVTTSVSITAKDINGNNVAKLFNSVSFLVFDYAKGMVRITDVTGEFYFSLLLITTLTYTVVAGVSTTVVMS